MSFEWWSLDLLGWLPGGLCIGRVALGGLELEEEWLWMAFRISLRNILGWKILVAASKTSHYCGSLFCKSRSSVDQVFGFGGRVGASFGCCEDRLTPVPTLTQDGHLLLPRTASTTHLLDESTLQSLGLPEQVGCGALVDPKKCVFFERKAPPNWDIKGHSWGLALLRSLQSMAHGKKTPTGTASFLHVPFTNGVFGVPLFFNPPPYN